MAKRPRSEIQSVLIHVKGEEHCVWIPKKIEISSWITLSAPKRGPWAKQGNFIAQVKKFKFMPNSTVLQSILVTHAYTHRQLECNLKSQCGAPSNRINYIYPTKCEDWQDPNSVLDVLVVLHAVIGEATRGCRTHKELLDCGILFYDSTYVPPTKKGKFGRLAIIPLPPLDDPSWPTPDMSSSESFRARLFLDFYAAMKTRTRGRICRLSSFMPFHIMADLFSGPGSIGMHRQTKTLYVFKPVSEALLASLMDDGWDVKREASGDIIKCHVLWPSIAFQYHVGRQMLYTTFGYVRERLMKGVWVPMDQADHTETRSLKIELFEGTHVSLDVGQTWGIRELREEVGYYMDPKVSSKWAFGIKSVTNTTRWEKINPRKEKTMMVEDIAEDKWLSIRAT